jgi:hypothetical protein
MPASRDSRDEAAHGTEAIMSEFDKLKDDAEQYGQQHPQQVQEGEQDVEKKFGLGGGQNQDQGGQNQGGYGQDQSGQDQGGQQDQYGQDQGSQQDQYGQDQGGGQQDQYGQDQGSTDQQQQGY